MSEEAEKVQRYDFFCHNKDDFVRILTLTDEDGEAQSITDWTFKMSVYEDFTGGAAAIASDNITITTLSASAGRIKVAIPDTIIDDLEIDGQGIFAKQTYYYDVVGVDSDGLQHTVLFGTFTVQKRLTTIA